MRRSIDRSCLVLRQAQDEAKRGYRTQRMEWSEEGILLSVRPHGEGAAVLSLMTRGQGRHHGLAKGATSRSAGGRYQPGNRLLVTWRGRLSEQLGHFICELVDCPAARLLDDPLRLAGLTAALAVTEMALPEREPHAAVFDGLEALIRRLAAGDPGWAAQYARWELALLAELGYGLDLARCAVSGAREGLAFVSPKTGRAVSAAGAGQWRERLLPLPEFLIRAEAPEPGPAAVAEALALTGYFLERHVFPMRTGRPGGPPARERLLQRLGRLRA
jgi:DNA repair protein RecO (recombination protein O)